MSYQLYKYKLPKDYVLPVELKQRLNSYAEKHKLSNEAMQEAVDIHVELTESYAEELKSYLKKKALQLLVVVAIATIALHLIIL